MRVARSCACVPCVCECVPVCIVQTCIDERRGREARLHARAHACFLCALGCAPTTLDVTSVASASLRLVCACSTHVRTTHQSECVWRRVWRAAPRRVCACTRSATSCTRAWPRLGGALAPALAGAASMRMRVRRRCCVCMRVAIALTATTAAVAGATIASARTQGAHEAACRREHGRTQATLSRRQRWLSSPGGVHVLCSTHSMCL